MPASPPTKCIELLTPTRAAIPPEAVDAARPLLDYEDLRATQEWRRWRAAQRQCDRGGHWFAAKFGRAALDAKVAELDAARWKSALRNDDEGWWTYSGLAGTVATATGLAVAQRYEDPAPVGCDYGLPYEPRDYQREALHVLTDPDGAPGPRSIQAATGLGKSLVIAMVLGHYGLPAVVVVPTLSIAGQLYGGLCGVFGRGQVGRLYDGKKEHTKRFLVAVSASLRKVAPGSPEADSLRTRRVLVGDEAHLLPADTLAEVVGGLLAPIPHRVFVSGTLDRHDGLAVLLEGLCGRPRMDLSFRWGVEHGWLSEPTFYTVSVPPDGPASSDALTENQRQYGRNPVVHRWVGGMLHEACRRGKRSLVLLDQVKQFPLLLPYLADIPHEFAHGGGSGDEAKKLPVRYRRTDPAAYVERFDAGDFPVLVGTGCIGIGTDVRTATDVFDLVGGAAENALRQRIGRGARRQDGKTRFRYYHFAPRTPLCLRQAEKRAAVMADAWAAPVEVAA